MRAIGGVVPDSKDVALLVAVTAGLAITPIAGGCLMGGAFGTPDTDSGMWCLLIGTVLVAAAIAVGMPREIRKMVWEAPLLWRATTICFGVMYGGGLCSVLGVKKAVDKIIAGEIAYGATVIVLVELAALGFGFFIFYFHLKDKVEAERIRKEAGSPKSTQNQQENG